MQTPTLGLLVQAVGVGLLALIFLYVSREHGNRVLQAAGYGWLFLFLALLSLVVISDLEIPFGNFPYQYLKVLYLVALVVAADRMEHEVPLGKTLGAAALVAIGASFLIVFFARKGFWFQLIETSMGAVAWGLIAILVYRSRLSGLGKQLSGLLALLTFLLQAGYAAVSVLPAARAGRFAPLLAYRGFYDFFLEMLFGIGLIIWTMEDTERRLAKVHRRAVDDTQRTRRRAQLDPLTETYNRLFLDEQRVSLSRDPAGGSIVLIDVDALKTINDTEGHEEGDKALWTVATAIKKLIRGDDYVIRWGGDEFLAVLPGMEAAVAEKRFYMLPAKIDEVRQSPRHTEKSYRRFLAASVGVTPYSRSVPFERAVAEADRAMYERKRAQKGMRGTIDEAPGALGRIPAVPRLERRKT